MGEFIQIFATYPNRDAANAAMLKLVEHRLAACAQVTGPIRSVYHWEGKIETSEEWLCLIKTDRALFPAVESHIKANHPYAVPEILAVPIVEGSEAYLQWMREELAKRG